MRSRWARGMRMLITRVSARVTLGAGPITCRRLQLPRASGPLTTRRTAMGRHGPPCHRPPNSRHMTTKVYKLTHEIMDKNPPLSSRLLLGERRTKRSIGEIASRGVSKRFEAERVSEARAAYIYICIYIYIYIYRSSARISHVSVRACLGPTWRKREKASLESVDERRSAS